MHGNIYPVTKDFAVKMSAQYNALKKVLKNREFSEFESNNKKKNNIFDISNVFKKDKKTIYYVDNVHYSGYGNELIAGEIYKIFNENR